MADTKASEVFFQTPIEVVRALNGARNVSPAWEPQPQAVRLRIDVLGRFDAIGSAAAAIWMTMPSRRLRP